MNWLKLNSVPEMGAISLNVFNNATEAAASAIAAAASAATAAAGAAFKGDWSALTGALNKPASVRYGGQYWLLLSNLADVTTATPGDCSPPVFRRR